MSLTWYGPEILRIRIWPGEKAPRKDSLCVVAEPDFRDWTISENSNGFVVSSAFLEARVGFNGEITFNRNGRTLLTAGNASFPANDLPNTEDRVGAE